MQGLIYFNVQCGITNLRIFSQGNCICGARSEENSRVGIQLVDYLMRVHVSRPAYMIAAYERQN